MTLAASYIDQNSTNDDDSHYVEYVDDSCLKNDGSGVASGDHDSKECTLRTLMK